jgi:hypothetical protein
MTIEERLERLERENRRLKYLLFSLLFLVVGVFFMGATTTKKESPIPDEVKAHKFTLVDNDGKVKGWLGMSPSSGEPSMALLGNKTWITLSTGEKMNGVDFWFGGIDIIPRPQSENLQEFLRHAEEGIHLGFMGTSLRSIFTFSVTGEKYSIDLTSAPQRAAIDILPVKHLEKLSPEEFEKLTYKGTENSITLALGQLSGQEGPYFNLNGQGGKGIFMAAIKEPAIGLYPSLESPAKAMLSILNGEGCLALYDNWDNLKFSK